MVKKIVCTACQQRINDSYVEVLGGKFHPQCFCCAACGKPIQSTGFMVKRSKPYHPECFHELFSPRCSACGKLIEGQYLRAMNKLWHPEHFVCAYCAEPIGDNYHVHKRKPYCSRDYLLLFAEKCALCGEPLIDHYMVDAWGHKYCARHEHEPRCSSCERLIGSPQTGAQPTVTQQTGGGVRYADDRLLCQLCRADAVDDVAAALHLMAKVKDVLASYDFSFDPRLKFPLNLVGQDELSAMIPKRRRSPNPAGLTHTEIITLNRAESSREIRSVSVLYGLPQVHLGAVLAHELGHVWLFMNRYPTLPRPLEEGVSELFASFWLKHLGTEEALVRLKQLEKNPDPLYGRGYRAVRRAVERTSLPFVMDVLKRKGGLP